MQSTAPNLHVLTPEASAKGRASKAQWPNAEKVARVAFVAEMWALGHSGLKIVELVEAEFGRSISYATVRKDVMQAREEWRERYAEVVEEGRVRQMKRLDALFKMAWGDGDVRGCVAVLDREAKLMGLDAPERAALDVKVEKADGELAEFMRALAARREAAVEGEVLDVE